MAIELSHNLFVEHSQYYTGCAAPTFLGIGASPHEALDDAIEQAATMYDEGEDDSPEATAAAVARRAAIIAYPNNEPDEPGELATWEGWDADGSEVSWHCELTIGGSE
jgi:hypothetical protein